MEKYGPTSNSKSPHISQLQKEQKRQKYKKFYNVLSAQIDIIITIFKQPIIVSVNCKLLLRKHSNMKQFI
jgi:hypothetical protein